MTLVGDARPTIVIHAGAGDRTAALRDREQEWHDALRAAIDRGRAALEAGGGALDAAQAAVAYMEDEADHFNAGRGSVLCADGRVEMSAAMMRGSDRAAGGVACVTRTRFPIEAARLVLESERVLMIGEQADAWVAAAGAEQCEPSYFVTDEQVARLAEDRLPSPDAAAVRPGRDGGTVGAVCLDSRGVLAAATSTGGVRGQLPGRVGDTPIFGAGTWADGEVAVSCTGEGEAFIRSGVARQIAARVAARRGALAGRPAGARRRRRCRWARRADRARRSRQCGDPAADRGDAEGDLEARARTSTCRSPDRRLSAGLPWRFQAIPESVLVPVARPQVMHAHCRRHAGADRRSQRCVTPLAR